MIKRFPWHTLWIVMFPLALLYAENIALVELKDVWLPFSISLAGTIVLFLVNWLIFRSVRKGAIAASLIVFLFFSYGAYHEMLFPKRILTFIGKGIRFDHNFYRYFSLCLLILVGWRLFKTKSKLFKITSLLNFATFVLLAMNLYNIVEFKLKAGKVDKDKKEAVLVEDIPENRPDIYYLMMDAYGREDVLNDIYNFDNGDFLNYLKEKGFFVADKSTSNYGQTVLSLPSTLNMTYLDSMADHYGEKHEDRAPLFEYLKNNKLLNYLHSIGYNSVAYDASIFGMVNLKTASQYRKTPGTYLNLYANELLNSTVIRAWNRREPISTLDNFEHHRKKVRAAFDHMENMPSKEGPNYIHGHVLVPHQPFVFNKDGSDRKVPYGYSIWQPMEYGTMNEEQYREGYIEQLQYVNMRLKQLINSILENSDQQPIIILQGDHGPCSELHNINGFENNNYKERMSILNAYYFPDQDYSMLYDSITPVNSFRVVMNEFFDKDYALLEDKAFYSDWTHLYHFHDVTDSAKRN